MSHAHPATAVGIRACSLLARNRSGRHRWSTDPEVCDLIWPFARQLADGQITATLKRHHFGNTKERENVIPINGRKTALNSHSSNRQTAWGTAQVAVSYTADLQTFAPTLTSTNCASWASHRTVAGRLGPMPAGAMRSGAPGTAVQGSGPAAPPAPIAAARMPLAGPGRYRQARESKGGVRSGVCARSMASRSCPERFELGAPGMPLSAPRRSRSRRHRCTRVRTAVTN